MNVEKQTYLNTEQLQALFDKKQEAVACYGAGSRFGGVRFHLCAKTEVTVTVEFHSVQSQADLRVDGVLVAKTSNKTSRFTLLLAKGDHVADVDCSSHGGFVIKAEGLGLKEGARYFDRVGGRSQDGETVLFMAAGENNAVSYRRTSGALETSVLSTPLYDSACLYDGNDYTSTVAYIESTNGRRKVHLYLNRDLEFTVERVESVAICDGRTLESGADYLAVAVEKGGKATLYRCINGTAIDDSAKCVWEAPLLRAVSAQQGSVLMLQDKNNVWTALFFHSNGEKQLHFTQHTYHYDEIPLCRNRYLAPTATVDEDGSPVFWYKLENGKLMRMAYGEAATEVGYAEAYHPGVSGGFWQYAGEVQYQAAE